MKQMIVAAIACLLFPVFCFAQRVINGKVTDEKGNPLENVSIFIKNTSKGTQTDAAGDFTIAADGSGTVVLTFTYTGYSGTEVSTDGSTPVTVAMQSTENNLNNVIVVGYGTQKQKDLTGSVAAISNKDFNQGVLLSPQQSIQGKVTGVNIAQNSGKPGGSNTIRIRGGTSLTQSNDPLYVIDGVPISSTAGVGQANVNAYSTNIFDMEPTNPLMTLNPDDIESVTVLKDASAAAIYGSRGANGVIVITTKRGLAGNPRVSLNASVGASKVQGTLDVLSAEQYRQSIKDLGLSIDDKGANTDWQDEIFRTGLAQDYDISISGGGNKTTYRASLGYGNQQSVMIGSDFKRANARININHSMLDDRLTFDLRVNYGQTFSDQAPVSNTVGSEFGSSMNYEAMVFNPTYPVRDSAGNYYNVPPYRVNPVSFSDQIFDELTNNRFIGNLSTTLKILKPLSVNVNLGYTNQNINRNSYISKANLLGQGTSGYASVQKLEDYSKLLETILRYNNHWGNHSVDAIGGYSWQYFVSTGDRTQASGFLSDAFKWYSLQAASTVNGVNTFQSSNTLISFYGRVNYSYADRLLVTGTVRRDGSSRFGEGNKWGTFPSGSVAWRISKENFFKANVISDLKIRASYGLTGNQEIGNLNSIQTLGATTSGYIVGGQRITTVLPQQYANPDLKWEQTGQFDIGVDFALFNSRLSGTIDYYEKKTEDLLLRIPVPSPTAVSTQLANVGSVQNKGVEISITGRIIDKTDFSWVSNFNISFNKNKVLSLSNDQFAGKNIQMAPLQGTVSLGKYAQLVIPGEPLGTFWGPKFTGIVDGKETLAYDGKDTIIGCAQPKYIWGFTNTFTYRRWMLNFLFRGSVGNDVFNLTAANMAYLSNLPGKNVLASALTSGIARDAPKQYSSRWIEDGSFVRLDNLTLSYDIGLKKTFISSARVFLTGQNLLLIAKYSGVDPEVNAEVSGTGTAPLGVDYLSYPRARTISIGANVTF
jgi:iron complex outermembrane receptor protein